MDYKKIVKDVVASIIFWFSFLLMYQYWVGVGYGGFKITQALYTALVIGPLYGVLKYIIDADLNKRYCKIKSIAKNLSITFAYTFIVWAIIFQVYSNKGIGEGMMGILFASIISLILFPLLSLFFWYYLYWTRANSQLRRKIFLLLTGIFLILALFTMSLLIRSGNLSFIA